MTLQEAVDIYFKCQANSNHKLCELCILNIANEDDQTLCEVLEDIEFCTENLKLEILNANLV